MPQPSLSIFKLGHLAFYYWAARVFKNFVSLWYKPGIVWILNDPKGVNMMKVS
jgi:hypothetical protein